MASTGVGALSASPDWSRAGLRFGLRRECMSAHGAWRCLAGKTPWPQPFQCGANIHSALAALPTYLRAPHRCRAPCLLGAAVGREEAASWWLAGSILIVISCCCGWVKVCKCAQGSDGSVPSGPNHLRGRSREAARACAAPRCSAPSALSRTSWLGATVSDLARDKTIMAPAGRGVAVRAPRGGWFQALCVRGAAALAAVTGTFKYTRQGTNHTRGLQAGPGLPKPAG